jgi:hypothetical protein
MKITSCGPRPPLRVLTESHSGDRWLAKTCAVDLRYTEGVSLVLLTMTIG